MGGFAPQPPPGLCPDPFEASPRTSITYFEWGAMFLNPYWGFTSDPAVNFCMRNCCRDELLRINKDTEPDFW